MNFTLHITDDCNFKCSYCPQQHQPRNMDFEIVKKAIKISMDKGTVTGFCFYGGEPLLNFSLIEKTIEYAKKVKDKTGHEFRFKLNTNGSLLTNDILQFLTEHDVGIGFSHDGLMQSACRKYANGDDTFETANEKARLLLQYQPDASVQTTVAPICVGRFANSVEWLLALGFQNILTTPAYGQYVLWNDKSLKELKNQYNKIAKIYEKNFSNSKPFYFAAFDTKIESGIKGVKNPTHICHIGKGQYSVTSDGKIYPCTQLINQKEFLVGDVFNGLDIIKQTKLSNIHNVPESCNNCAVNSRCINSCGCINMMETGYLSKVSPMQCEHERMLIQISDKLSEKLYKSCKEIFIKRFYI